MNYRVGIDFIDIMGTKEEVRNNRSLSGIGLFCRDIVQGLIDNGHGSEIVIFTRAYSMGFIGKMFPNVKIQKVSTPPRNLWDSKYYK